MKKLLLLLAVLAFFVTGCKNNKTANTPNLNNREKDDYGKNDNIKNDNEKTPDQNTVSTGWTENDKSTFLKECVGAFDENNTAVANQICPCVLGKIEKEYASYSDAETKGGEEAGKRLSIQCKEEISGTDNTNNTNNNGTVGWSSTERNQYVDNCVSSAVANGMERGTAQQYCSCMQKKFENLYPNTNDLSNLSKEQASDISKRFAQECIKE